jgi:hypothetical protein
MRVCEGVEGGRGGGGEAGASHDEIAAVAARKRGVPVIAHEDSGMVLLLVHAR